MGNSQEFRTGRLCVFNTHIHLVFVAKYRRIVFANTILEAIRDVLEVELVEFYGEGGHML